MAQGLFSEGSGTLFFTYLFDLSPEAARTNARDFAVIEAHLSAPKAENRTLSVSVKVARPWMHKYRINKRTTW